MASPTLEAAIGGDLEETTSTTPDMVHQLVRRARGAQAVFEQFPQERVDAIVRDFAKYVYDNAELVAGMAHKETGLGVYDDKVLKAKGKARVIWNNLKGKKSRGIIGEDDEQNLVLIAKPMGVVGAVCPVTNPIVTPMCNAMFALKAGNAIIFAPHPKADDLTWFLTKEYQRIVRKHGGPDHLVQTVRHGSVETTQALMKAVDVVVATGGGAMVKSAYSSGKPSYGVGAGNVPVVIDRGVDLEDAAEKITAGAAFDNGIIRSHEQFVLAPREQYKDTIAAFVKTGAVWFTDDETKVEKLRQVVFPNGHLNKDVVGRSAQEIGKRAGIDIPSSAKIILIPARGAGRDDVLAKEKLCPVVAILPYGSFDEAVEKAKANLLQRVPIRVVLPRMSEEAMHSAGSSARMYEPTLRSALPLCAPQLCDSHVFSGWNNNSIGLRSGEYGASSGGLHRQPGSPPPHQRLCGTGRCRPPQCLCA